MKQFPTLETKRLLLRAFLSTDAQDLKRLLNDKAIARTTLSIPYPYEEGAAEALIEDYREKFERSEKIGLAIVHLNDRTLLGGIVLTLNEEHGHAELGYWIGKPHWGNGYATEASEAILSYGFNELKLNRIHAAHMGSNPSSGRILEKIGMSYEGCLRQHFNKWGTFEDSMLYGILKSEYQSFHKKR